MFQWIEGTISSLCQYFLPYPTVRVQQIGNPEESEEDEPVYDYIIVGGPTTPLSPGSLFTYFVGGTAGCVLANRLSEHPSIKVLLLERGKVLERFLSRTIFACNPVLRTFPLKEIDLAPQIYLSKRRISTYEAFGLGGRTRINGGLYLYGSPKEYDNWGEGWQWEDVAPSFASLERRLEQSSSSPAEWTTRVTQPIFESTRRYTT